jgi:hypothetical protein
MGAVGVKMNNDTIILLVNRGKGFSVPYFVNMKFLEMGQLHYRKVLPKKFRASGKEYQSIKNALKTGVTGEDLVIKEKYIELLTTRTYFNIVKNGEPFWTYFGGATACYTWNTLKDITQLLEYKGDVKFYKILGGE